MNILNPFGFVFLDCLYYMLVVGLGPLLFWYLLLFRPKQNKLHDAYLHTGVETLGIVTHRKVIITRGSITRVERSRTFHIRYAYKAPGTDAIYVKDFVQVNQNQLQQRLIRVVVLPGQPESGVPDFLINERRMKFVGLCLSYLLSLLVIAFGIYLFQLLFASQITGHCVERDRIMYCVIYPIDTALSIITVLTLGLLGAWLMYRAERASVPGRVWTSMLHHSEAASTAVRVDNTLDDRIIPMAQVMAVLDNDDEDHAEATTQESTTATAYPVPSDNYENPGPVPKDAPLPEARTIEMV